MTSTNLLPSLTQSVETMQYVYFAVGDPADRRLEVDQNGLFSRAQQAATEDLDEIESKQTNLDQIVPPADSPF